MNKFTYVQSATDKVYNYETGNFLDVDLNLLSQDIVDLQNKVRKFKCFDSFKTINLVEGSETIADIANNLPDHSMFIYHKTSTSGNSSIYPEITGLLIVMKGRNANRVKFEYSTINNNYIGFYDSNIFSGWKKINTNTTTIQTYQITDIIKENIDTVGIIDLIKSMPDRSEVVVAIGSNDAYKQIVKECPTTGILKIYKERNTRTTLEFTSAENGHSKGKLPKKYFANYDGTSNILSNWCCLYLISGPSSDRPVSVDVFSGAQYFDTTLNKPIWWDGSKWIDATGASV